MLFWGKKRRHHWNIPKICRNMLGAKFWSVVLGAGGNRTVYASN